LEDDAAPASLCVDRLLLWAVAGLTGVVIGGGAAGRGARAPRAVLWGQHTGTLIWHSLALVNKVKTLLFPCEN